MRFMYDYNEIPNVEMIEEIDASPCWKDGTENNPDSFIVTMYRAGWHNATKEKREHMEIWGEYLLDGTEATYKKAVANYRKVCKQLLEKGFVRASDFENFDWD